MELIYYPNPLLLVKTIPVKPDGLEKDEDLWQKIGEMFEIMYRHKGVGLAAPQVGWNARLFIANASGNDKNGELTFINPRIKMSHGRTTEEEGCLSFPGIYAMVERAQEIEVEYENEKFETLCMNCDGLLARIVQHEMDHLDKLLLVHRMSHTDKIRNKRQLEEMEAENSDREKNGS